MNDEESKTRDVPIIKVTSLFVEKEKYQLSTEYAELMSDMLREYGQAAAKCRFEGDDRQATYYEGIANGILISWEQFKQLEHDFPTDQ